MTHESPRASWYRWALMAGLVLLSIALIAFGSGSSQATSGKNVAALAMEKEITPPRAYQFTGQGKIAAGFDTTWVIGGVPVVIGDQTKTEGVIYPGNPVSLVGHIATNGDWVAERIVPIAEEEAFFNFAGPLESIGKDSWQVAGITLTIDAATSLGEAIPIGEVVLATFQVQPDGAWLALQIQALADLEKERTPTVTPTATPTATATATPVPAPSSSRDTQGGQVTVCHKPNHKKGGTTIVVDSTSLAGHLAHGDTLGACR